MTIIFSVKCSFPNLQINEANNGDSAAHLYQNMFTSLLSARRMIETVGKHDGDGTGVKIIRRGISKEIWKKLKENETFHNVPLAIYECINLRDEVKGLIDAEKRYYSITVYKLK